jgi:hypothetical protein
MGDLYMVRRSDVKSWRLAGYAAMVPLGVGEPTSRSLRIGSRPFQSARAKRSRCRSSANPGRPSSPQ